MNGMDFLSILRRRRSVREFADRPVGDDDLDFLLEAARIAPSSNNTQPWRFVVVRDPEAILRLSGAAPVGVAFNRRWMSKAPCLIVGCAEPAVVYHRAIRPFLSIDLAEIDVTIATEHIVLAAAERGLGTCWIGWFDEGKIRKILGLPRRWRVIAMLAVGWPKDPLEEREPKRKAIGEIAFLETPDAPWGQSR